MSKEFLLRRIDSLRKQIRDKDLDAVMILPGSNMRYLLDIKVESYERLVAASFSSSGIYMIIPELERERIRELAGDLEIEFFEYSDAEGPKDVLANLLVELGASSLGIEGSAPYKTIRMIKDIEPKLDIQLIDDLLYELRMIKDDEEIKRLKKAQEIDIEGLIYGASVAKVGMNELELKREIENKLFDLGAESIPFCLVQSGPNTALPHGESTKRRISEGDLVLMDVGVNYEGYVADITRTIVIGKPTNLQKKIYSIVKNAQETAISYIKPGVAAEEIDKVARGIISGEGYGDNFIHRTGHGIGLDVHEEPFIREGNKLRLKRGMVFTVEPGIYLPGEFGVRIEDNLIVTENGAINLTRLDKELKGRLDHI